MTRGKILLLLFVLVVFHMANNIFIVSMDNTPFLWDGGDYFFKSLKYYDVFADIGSGFISRFNEVSPYRPPLFLLSSLPFYAILGRTPDVAVMTNFIYLIIMVLSVFGIGKRIRDEQTGLLAAFLVSFFPILFGLSRSYWLDYPLTAMVCLASYVLLRTDIFRNRKFTLLFGVVCGLGMLTKWTFFVFIAGPFLYFLIAAYRIENSTPVQSLVNIVLAFVSGVAVCSFWYIPNGMNVAGKLLGLAVGVTGEKATRFQQLGESFGPSGIFNIHSLAYYAGQLVNHQLTFLTAVIFIILVVYLLVTHGEKQNILWLLFWVIVPVVAFTLIKNKTVRNTVPMLPAIGLLMAMGIMAISKDQLRKTMIVLVVVLSLFQYTVSSYGIPILPEKLRLMTPLGDVIFFQQHESTSYALYRAKTGDWKADEILDTLHSTRRHPNEVRVVLIPRDAFTWMAMEYSSHLRGMSFEFIGAVNDPEAVLGADYVLIKKGGFTAPWFLMGNIHRSLGYMEKEKGNFGLIKVVELPEDRFFLPVYDLEAPSKASDSGVVFSGKLQVLDYSVTDSGLGPDREFVVQMTLKSLENLNSELMLLFSPVNKKMQRIMQKAVRPSTPITGWSAGEIISISATLAVPPKVSKQLFSLDIGFLDEAEKKLLSYRPEYLIFKRTRR